MVARLPWEQEVAGSNPVIPIRGWHFPKVESVNKLEVHRSSPLLPRSQAVRQQTLTLSFVGSIPTGVGMKDFKSIGKTVEGNEGDKCNYPYRLDTYGCGCQHDCSYYYAKSLLDFRGLWNPQNPSVANIADISKEIKKIPRGTIVRLGGMTDCFQPAEKIYRNTYKTIRLLNKRRIPYLIVTKSAIVAEKEYLEVLDKDLAHIQITVTTLDDDLSLTYEKASKPTDRVEAIKTLQEHGFDVQLRLSPFIPQYVDFDRFNALGIDKILVEFLRVNTWIKKWFDIDYSEYTVRQSSYQHLPLKKKLEYISKLTGFKEMTVCEDEDNAYNYWKYHFNHNKDDCCNLRRSSYESKD